MVESCQSIPQNSHYNSISSFTRTWDGSNFIPLSEDRQPSFTTDNSVVCGYSCDLNFTWNGTSCIAGTQSASCPNLPSNAEATNGRTYTQTWNGSEWSPSLSANIYDVSGTSNCSFQCSSGYTHNNGNCESALPSNVLASVQNIFSHGIGTTIYSIQNNGDVYGWGLENDHTFTSEVNWASHKIATKITTLTGVKKISSGSQHACALYTNGSVKCWGENGGGYLGDNSFTYAVTPVQVQGLTSGVVDISSYYQHTCALLNDSTIKCWGSNMFGGLGIGNEYNSEYPVTVSTSEGGPASTDFTKVCTGTYYTCGVKTDNKAYCWGYGGSNNLGSTGNKNVPTLVPNLTAVSDISCGDDFTCFLLSDGSVKCSGQNGNGQLGNGSNANVGVVIQTVVGIGEPATKLFSGQKTSCVITQSNKLKCWGDGNYGETGTGSDSYSATEIVGLGSIPTSVTISSSTVCSLLSDGSVKCWGDNSWGQVGGNSTDGYILSPTQVQK